MWHLTCSFRGSSVADPQRRFLTIRVSVKQSNLLWEEMLCYEARHPLRAKLSHRTTLLGTLEIQFDMFWGLDFSFSFFLRWKGLNSNFFSLLLLMYFGSFGSQNCFSSHKHMLFFFGPSRAAVGGRRDKFPNHTSAQVWTPGSKQRWKLL